MNELQCFLHYSEVPMLLQLVWTEVKNLHCEKHSQANVHKTYQRCTFVENVRTMETGLKKTEKTTSEKWAISQQCAQRS